MKPLCIYHGNCADGFGAAWVVRKALGDVEFHASVYQDAPPDVSGRDVIMVDFSFRRDVMHLVANLAKSVLVIDHHKSAAEDLADFHGPNYTQHFDMNHSGAMLTWMHYFPDTPPPKLIEHIEDRDLWHFALRGTREIQANLFSYPYDFEVWDDLMAAPVESLIADGRVIERKQHKDVAELVPVCRREMTIGGITMPVASLPYTLSSDAGHLMASQHSSKVAACYWDTPDGRVFSLRSTDDGPDVSEIAMLYGGGGHRHASGFRVPYGHELTR
jgi:oligoribonuclease NrnB/cAMP/cGMP phosphodiesterase (DHH superfamily)